jgi:hypothetical protein
MLASTCALLLMDVIAAFVLPALPVVPTCGRSPISALSRLRRPNSGVATALRAAKDGGSRDNQDDVSAADDSSALFASLRARQEALKLEEKVLLKNWRTGKCISKAGPFFDDWVRRVSLDWPLVAGENSQQPAR